MGEGADRFSSAKPARIERAATCPRPVRSTEQMAPTATWQPAAYATWTEARRAAWDDLPSSTDAYYHSFLPPGEKPATGEWAAREMASFMTLLQEHPEKVEKGLWGLFSLHQPGRTGSQCQARYEKLKAARQLPPPLIRGEERPAAREGGGAAGGVFISCGRADW